MQLSAERSQRMAASDRVIVLERASEGMVCMRIDFCQYLIFGTVFSTKIVVGHFTGI